MNNIYIYYIYYYYLFTIIPQIIHLLLIIRSIGNRRCNMH